MNKVYFCILSIDVMYYTHSKKVPSLQHKNKEENTLPDVMIRLNGRSGCWTLRSHRKTEIVGKSIHISRCIIHPNTNEILLWYLNVNVSAAKPPPSQQCFRPVFVAWVVHSWLLLCNLIPQDQQSMTKMMMDGRWICIAAFPTSRYIYYLYSARLYY